MPSPRAAAALVAAAVVAGALGCTSDGDDGTAPTSTAAPGATAGPAPTPATPTAPTTPAPPGGLRPVGEPEVVASGLSVPWGLAFLPDGSALVGERATGRVVRVVPGGPVEELGTVPGVAPSSEGGLLGLAVSPSFERDGLVTAYLSTAEDNRIVRFPVAGGALGPVEPLVTGIDVASVHDGGRLAFGPDGMLYATTGDAGRPEAAQDLSSPNGKVLRMTPDGRPAPGNPFDGSLVWSYGHRNVEGLAWDGDGRLWASELGEDRLDEVNLIEAGANYGWPEVEGDEGGGEAVASGLTAPLVTWPTAESSPSGVAVAGGALWVGALRGQGLWRIPLGEGGTLGQPEKLEAGTYGRIRTVTAAPDGSLWITTSNRDGRGRPGPDDDRIFRLTLG